MGKQADKAPIGTAEPLKGRERTRLWFRKQRETEDTAAQGRPYPAVRIIKAGDSALPIGTDRLVAESMPRTSNLQRVLDEVDEVAEPSQPSPKAVALTEWRDTPGRCPVLLLSAAPILDARNPGPILGPGTRYRVLSVADGVVALEVIALDGRVGVGYCNAVDLYCVVPDIASLRREGGANGRQTSRLSLNRISQRISGVTAALVG